MLTKQLGLVLVLAAIICVVYSKECDTYKGRQCRRNYEQAVINTNNCERKCVTIFFRVDCARICESFSGPTCTNKQRRRNSACSCKSTCIDVLEQGEQCDDKGKSFCKNNLNCVDGICKA